jgi:two-component system, OmpR family, alkaline phosphatase synthesis response regulator PhoP
VSHTVLVVEDEPDIAMTTRVSLELAGYRVLVAETAEQARERIEEPIDAVVLDLRLPDRDGWWVVDEIRSRPEKASIPIVVVSAHASPSTLARARNQGLPYVTKPFAPDRLVGLIGEILGSQAREDVDPDRPSPGSDQAPPLPPKD